MRRFVSSLCLAVAALLGAVTLAMSSTITSTVGLVATTVLYMRGTNIGGFLPDDVYAAYAGQRVTAEQTGVRTADVGPRLLTDCSAGTPGEPTTLPIPS